MIRRRRGPHAFRSIRGLRFCITSTRPGTSLQPLEETTAAPYGAAVFLYAAGMNEFEIIGRFFAPLAGEGAFGLKDDAALITARPGFDLVVTTDAISEGTDFFAFDPADTIAQKA